MAAAERDDGSFRFPADGTVVLRFDNSYSRFRSKTVVLAASVKEAGESGGVDDLLDGDGDSVQVDTPFGVGELLRVVESSADGEGADVYVVQLSSGVAYLHPSRVHMRPRAQGELDKANLAAMRGLDLFLQNRFVEAEEFFGKGRNRLPVFALGHATMAFMKAAMTWSKTDIAEAIRRLKHAQTLCATFMPTTSTWRSIGQFVGVADQAPMTAEELEGTLLYAEATLILAVQHLMEESVAGFVRCGLAVREGLKLYETCDRAMNRTVSSIKGGDFPVTEDFALGTLPGTTAAGAAGAAGGAGGAGGPTAAASDTGGATTSEGIPVSAHAVGGVQFGMGTFNVVISVLPPLVLRIVSALGFPCDREQGLSQLRACMLGGGLRAPLAAVTFMVQHVIMPSFFSSRTEYHLAQAEPVMRGILARYPDAAELLWLNGRLLRMKCDLHGAIGEFQRCVDAQDEWIQMKHLGQYELGWCYYFLGQYPSCIPVFAELEENNEWSKAFYCYMVAVAHLEQGDLVKAKEKMKQVTGHMSKIKLGGKTISVEHFVYRRAKEFNSASADGQPTALAIPAIEIVYLFNGFKQMPPDVLSARLVAIDAALRSLAAEGHAGGPEAGLLAGTPVTAAAGAGGKQPKKSKAKKKKKTKSTSKGKEGSAGGAGSGVASPADVVVSGVSVASSAELLDAVGARDDPDYDAAAVCALCRGTALAALGHVDEAMVCYQWIQDHQSEIKRDNYTIPFSAYEMGVLAGEDGKPHFKRASDYSKDFNFKLRLALRVHLALDDMRRRFGVDTADVEGGGDADDATDATA